LTALSAVGVGLSADAKKVWGFAIVDGQGCRLGSVTVDSFALAARPLASPLGPGPKGGGSSSSPAGAAATPHARQKILAAASAGMGAAQGASGAEAQHPAHRSLAAAGVRAADVPLLAAALSRNRYLTSVDLRGAVFGPESLQVTSCSAFVLLFCEVGSQLLDLEASVLFLRPLFHLLHLLHLHLHLPFVCVCVCNFVSFIFSSLHCLPPTLHPPTEQRC
jgi:hypothetical protein